MLSTLSTKVLMCVRLIITLGSTLLKFEGYFNISIHLVDNEKYHIATMSEIFIKAVSNGIQLTFNYSLYFGQSGTQNNSLTLMSTAYIRRYSSYNIFKPY